MQILSISLKNFKSHFDSHFQFEAGTNAICGENGAGKTSILEGIAWVLFDYSPYNQDEMVRSGANSAEVTVTFISHDDERTYEVRRGTNSGYRIYDPQLNYRLEYERKADILPWVRQHLGVPAGTDLPRLFTTTIGVPQGTFTADFLKTAKDRKEIFDKILKVEEYQTVSKDLLGLEKYSDQQVSDLKHRIELLSVQLREWDPLLQEQHTLSAELTQTTTAFQQQQAILLQYQTEIAQLDRIAQELTQHDQHWQELQQQLSLQQLHLNQAEKDLNIAQVAQAKTETSRAGSLAFQQAESTLQELEIKQQARHRLLQEREELLDQDRERQTQLTRLQERVQVLEQATQELETLQPQIQQQEKLEAQRQELIIQAEHLAQMQQDLQVLRARWDAQKKECQQLTQSVAEAEQAQQICQISLPGYRAVLEAEEQLTLLEQQVTHRQELLRHRDRVTTTLHHSQVQLAGLQHQRDRLLQVEAEWQTLKTRITEQETLEQKQAKLQDKLQQFQSIRLQLGQSQTEHQQIQQQHQDLKVAIEQRMQQQIDGEQIPALEQQLEHIGSQLSRVAAARQFQQELQIAFEQGNQGLTLQTQQVQKVLRTLQQIQREFPQLQPRLDGIPPILTQGTALTHQLLQQMEQVLIDLSHQVSIPQLEQQQQEHKQHLQQLYSLKGLVDQLPDLRSQEQTLQERIAQLQTQIDDLNWELEAEPTFTRQLAEIQTLLHELGDPRTQATIRQQELKARPQLDQEWQTIQTLISEQTQELQQLAQDLQISDHLEAEIKAHQQQKQKHREAHQRYLQNEVLASTLFSRQQELEIAEQTWQQIEQTGKQQQAAIAQLESEVGSSAVITDLQKTVQRQLSDLQDPKAQAQRLQEQIKIRPQIEQELQGIRSQLDSNHRQLEALEKELAKTATLEAEIITQRQIREQHRPDYELYLNSEKLAQTLPQCQQTYQQIRSQLEALTQQLGQIQTQRDQIANAYTAEHHQNLKELERQVQLEQARLQTQIQVLHPQLEKVKERIHHLESLQGEQKQIESTLTERERLHRFIKFSRDIFKKAGPRITEMYLQNVNIVADRLFREILNRPTVSLIWESDYDITVQESGSPKRRFALLSGGEQMSAALAVRLALLRVLGEIDIAFFDEPTTNMDQQRRLRLAEAITNIKSFRQLFVISHDDTFEQVTENIIRVERRDPLYGA